MMSSCQSFDTIDKFFTTPWCAKDIKTNQLLHWGGRFSFPFLHLATLYRCRILPKLFFNDQPHAHCSQLKIFLTKMNSIFLFLSKTKKSWTWIRLENKLAVVVKNATRLTKNDPKNSLKSWDEFKIAQNWQK